MRVLITGGTGKTGRRLSTQLRAAGVEVRTASRRVGQGRDEVSFDWGSPQHWDEALNGVTAAYLVPPPHDPAPALISFCERALQQGCRRWVLLSASLLPRGGPGAGKVHEWLEARCGSWGVVRPSWFMENFSEGPLAKSIRDEDAIYSAAADGRVAFVSADDIAAVAAAMLTSLDAPNRDAIVTGPSTLNYDEVAEVLSRVTGRLIRHIRIPVEQLAASHIAHGVAAATAQVVAGMDRLIAQGAEDRVTDEVMTFANRPPMIFDRFAAQNRSVWDVA